MLGFVEGAHLTELAQLISTLGSQEVHINDVCARVCVFQVSVKELQH